MTAEYPSNASSRSAREALTRLTRIAQKKAQGPRFLDRALAGRLDGLAGLAFEVIVETGDPLGRVLAERLEREGDADLVGELAERIDRSDHVESVPLRELALVVVTRSLEIRRHVWSEPSPAQRAIMAELCVTRGLRLQDVGRLEEGLEAVREGLTEFRRLAWKEPERYRTDVAEAFHNLAIILGEMLRNEEAVRASRRAVNILRRRATNPSKLVDYAIALDHLGIQLQAAGRDREALGAFRAAVAAASSALPADKSRSSKRADPVLLARLRLNLGLMHWRLGRGEDALETTQLAVDELRRHFDARPHVVGVDFARGLTNLSMILGGLGSPEASLRVSREAVDLRRRLVKERPEIFRPELAHSLVNFGMDLGELGRWDEAFEATHEAAQMLRDLVCSRPDERPNLARVLDNLAVMQRGLGQPEAALESLREARELWTALDREDSGRHRGDLATNWSNLGTVELDLKRTEEALAAMERATELLERLAAERPGTFEARLAMSFDRLAVVRDDLGRKAAAIAAARRAVGCYRRLASEQPEVATDLAVALTNLGVLLDGAGEPAAGLAAIREAVETQRSKGGSERDPNLAGMLHRLGVRLAEHDRLDEAVEATREATEIWRRLASEEPEDFQSELVDSLHNLAAMLRNLGQTEAALRVESERDMLALGRNLQPFSQNETGT